VKLYTINPHVSPVLLNAGVFDGQLQQKGSEERNAMYNVVCLWMKTEILDQSG
jgi:hypothetical protein